VVKFPGWSRLVGRTLPAGSAGKTLLIHPMQIGFV
jgi:hypothetical protein